MKTKFISKEQELYFIARFKDGDGRYMKRLIDSYIPLLKSRAHNASRRNHAIEYDDFFQAAAVGFIIACERYNPSAGTRIGTFAEMFIKSEFERLAFANHQINIGRTQTNRILYNRYARTCRKLNINPKNISFDDAKAVAGYLDVKTSDVVSFAHFLYEKNARMDDNSAVFQAVQEEELNLKNRNAVLQAAVEALPEREKLVVELTLARTPALTLGDVGEMLGISSERVRQIRNEGTSRMHDWLKSKNIKKSDLEVEDI